MELRKITKEELDEILKLHKMWLNDEDDGVRANLSGANLSGANLSGANLSGANISEANLSEANLRGVYLVGADIGGADLSEANLSGANLGWADLSGVYIGGANLSGADLRRARNLDTVKYNELTSFFALQCPEEGLFIGYKKVIGDLIVKLQITEDSKRSSATSRKCRCSKAKVLEIQNLDGSVSNVKKVVSNYDSNFIYKVGEVVEVKDFDENRWNECASGIHFFITRQEAVKY